MSSRAFILTIAAFALTAAGCASHSSTSAAPQSAHAATREMKSYTMLAAGAPVLKLSAPADAPATLEDGGFDLKSREGYVNIWLVRGATTVQDAIARVPSVIASEFKEFQSTSSTTLPGTPAAMRLMGKGLEADDNDPGTADVIVFQRGPRIFIACTHGETMRTTAQALMVRIVESATQP